MVYVCLKVSGETRDLMKSVGYMDETYDTLIVALIKESGRKIR